MRLYHDHCTCARCSPTVCGWCNWYTPSAEPWSNFLWVNLGVVVSRCILNSPFCVTGPFGPHYAGYTLGLRLQLHWLAMEPIVEDEPGVEILSCLLFCMWLATFPAWGEHDALPLNLNGWLTHLLKFWDVFRGWFCNQLHPHIFLSSWREIYCKYLQVWK